MSKDKSIILRTETNWSLVIKAVSPASFKSAMIDSITSSAPESNTIIIAYRKSTDGILTILAMGLMLSFIIRTIHTNNININGLINNKANISTE